MDEHMGMTVMEKFVDHEKDVLQTAKDTGNPVRLIFTNGYQTEAVIEDFNMEVLVARVRDEKWLVYKYNLSTIVF